MREAERGIVTRRRRDGRVAAPGLPVLESAATCRGSGSRRGKSGPPALVLTVTPSPDMIRTTSGIVSVTSWSNVTGDRSGDGDHDACGPIYGIEITPLTGRSRPGRPLIRRVAVRRRSGWCGATWHRDQRQREKGSQANRRRRRRVATALRMGSY